MTSRDLDTFLKRLEIPEVNSSAVERALQKAAKAYGDEPAEIQVPVGKSGLKGLTLELAQFAFIITVLLTTWLLVAEEDVDKAMFERNARLFSEIEEIFPGDLAAVVENHYGMNLVLSESVSIEKSRPYWVEITKNGQTARIIGYPGISLEVPIGSVYLTVRLKLDDWGNLLVMGKDFTWQSGSNRRPHGYRIKAVPLRTA